MPEWILPVSLALLALAIAAHAAVWWRKPPRQTTWNVYHEHFHRADADVIPFPGRDEEGA